MWFINILALIVIEYPAANVCKVLNLINYKNKLYDRKDTIMFSSIKKKKSVRVYPPQSYTQFLILRVKENRNQQDFKLNCAVIEFM